ncbi:hypothetical protein [Desulforamulus reducens]|nr:hypothetical protein [Desulforamulus reducens]
MKRFTFDQLVNDKTRKKTRKLQLTTITSVSKEDRAKRGLRNPEETILLVKSLRKHIQRLKNERILVKNGRNWRLYL